MERYTATSAEETGAIGGRLAPRLAGGDVVLLHGELGAGKTTFVRGLLAALGHKGTVRSPTFNLIQTFETIPPVMHADLYRVQGYEGIGIEDYLETHVCLIEWPERAEGLVKRDEAWNVTIRFKPKGREIDIQPPERA